MRRVILALLIVCLTVSSSFAQPTATDRPSIRVRLTGNSGERVTGHARAIQGDVLEFEHDGNAGQITLIKMDSLSFIERGSRRAARPLATAAGVGAGVLGAVGSIVGALLWCNDESVEGACWGLMQALAFVGSPILGGLLGWHLGRTNWKRISAEELERLLALPNLP